MTNPTRRRRPFPLVILPLLLLLSAGCGGDEIGATVPVAGKVTLDGRPVSRGTVVFQADAEAGNHWPHEARGDLSADGRYELRTLARKPGAAPGRYRVAVVALEPPSMSRPGAPIVWLVPARYGDLQTSSLRVEVAAHPAPGAYDLQLTQSDGSDGNGK